MTKDERIDKERKRLSGLLKGAEKRDILEPVIDNCAFMKVTLEDLQDAINEQGGIDYYQNGNNQFGKKASAELQAYNAMMKNYTQAMDKLLKLECKQERKKSFREIIEEIHNEVSEHDNTP